AVARLGSQAAQITARDDGEAALAQAVGGGCREIGDQHAAGTAGLDGERDRAGKGIGRRQPGEGASLHTTLGERGDDRLGADAQQLVARFRRHFPFNATNRSWLSFGHISRGLVEVKMWMSGGIAAGVSSVPTRMKRTLSPEPA